MHAYTHTYTHTHTHTHTHTYTHTHTHTYTHTHTHTHTYTHVQRKASKAPGDYQVVKQDPEELANVCKVMEDLIRMHISIFTVSTHSGITVNHTLRGTPMLSSG